MDVCVCVCVCVMCGVCVCVCMDVDGCVCLCLYAGNPVARLSAAGKGKPTQGKPSHQSPVPGAGLLAASPLNYICWHQIFLHGTLCQIPEDKRIAGVQLGFRLGRFLCM